MLDGNPGKRKLTIVEFPTLLSFGCENATTQYNALRLQKHGKPLIATEISEGLGLANERGCASTFPAGVGAIRHERRSWIQCEAAITEYGFSQNIRRRAAQSSLVCGHEPKLHVADKPALVSDLPDRQGKLRCDYTGPTRRMTSWSAC
jgi:hypothetical protein